MLPPDDDAAPVEDEADIVPPGEIGVGFLRVVVRDVKAAAGKFLNPCCLQRVPAPRAPAYDFSAV